MDIQKNKKSSKIKIIKNYITQRSGDSISIFDPEKSVLSTFNNTGTFIFERLKQEANTGNIVKELIKEFDVTEKTAEKDLNSFIEMLIKKGFAQEVTVRKNKTQRENSSK